MKKDEDDDDDDERTQIGLCCGAGQCSGRLRRNKQRRIQVNEAEFDDFWSSRIEMIKGDLQRRKSMNI